MNEKAEHHFESLLRTFSVLPFKNQNNRKKAHKHTQTVLKGTFQIPPIVHVIECSLSIKKLSSNKKDVLVNTTNFIWLG